jgi:hypothetical protein
MERLSMTPFGDPKITEEYIISEDKLGPTEIRTPVTVTTAETYLYGQYKELKEAFQGIEKEFLKLKTHCQTMEGKITEIEATQKTRKSSKPSKPSQASQVNQVK